MRYVVLGPSKTRSDAARRMLAQILEGTGFGLLEGNSLEGSALAEREEWPRLREILETARLLEFRQFQEVTCVDAWRRVKALDRKLRNQKLPRWPWLFIQICRCLAVDKPQLRFADGVSPASLTPL